MVKRKRQCADAVKQATLAGRGPRSEDVPVICPKDGKPCSRWACDEVTCCANCPPTTEAQ